MRPIRLSQAAALAAFAAAYAPSAPAAAQTADRLLARNLAATCANCHGTDGRAVGDMKPLAGIPADKILAQLAEFRAGNQAPTIMHQIVKGYSEAQLQLIAGYFAAQAPAR